MPRVKEFLQRERVEGSGIYAFFPFEKKVFEKNKYLKKN